MDRCLSEWLASMVGTQLGDASTDVANKLVCVLTRHPRRETADGLAETLP
jgi:hypothetical protein